MVMAYLFVSTDAWEAEALIEDTGPNQKPKYRYHEVDAEHGKNLANRLGFNPMCSVEFNGQVTKKQLELILQKTKD